MHNFLINFLASFVKFLVISFSLTFVGFIFFQRNIILFFVVDMTGRRNFLPKTPRHFIHSNVFTINFYQCIRSSSQIVPEAEIIIDEIYARNKITKLQNIIVWKVIKNLNAYQGIFTDTWCGICQFISKCSSSKIGW